MREDFKVEIGLLQVLIEKVISQEPGERFILGIDGLSRSGKTSLVKKLEHFLIEKNIPVHIFHLDDFITSREKRYNTGNEDWYEYYHLQWDIEWLSEHFFKKLKSINQFILPYYQNETDSHFLKENSLLKQSLIIVEGVFLQRKEWRTFFDFVFYLDCPRKQRFQRENEETQKNLEKFKNRYWKAEEYYLKTETPIEKANFTLSYQKV